MTGFINGFKAVFGIVGGLIAGFLGGIDGIMIALLIFIVVDYLTGVIKAIYEKRLSSEIGYKGIIKKVLMLIIVGVAWTLQKYLAVNIPIREMVIMFFVANEGISIIENISEITPVPDKLKDLLLQLKEQNNK